MDAYVILKCRSQEHRSSIASGKGSNLERNESFVFIVSDRATDLLIKLLDSDTGTTDDFIGEATCNDVMGLEIYSAQLNWILKNFFGSSVHGREHSTNSVYVVKGEQYYGEIKVGLTFTPESIQGFVFFRKACSNEIGI